MAARSAQAALESLSLIGFLTITTLILTTSLIQTYNDKTSTNQHQALQQLTKIIQNEITLATNAPPGYTRNITLPTKIAGRKLTINLTKNPHNGIIELNLNLPHTTISTLLPPQTYGTLTTGTNTIHKNTQGIITITPQNPTSRENPPQNANPQLTPPHLTTTNSPNPNEAYSNSTLKIEETILNLPPGDYTLTYNITLTNTQRKTNYTIPKNITTDTPKNTYTDTLTYPLTTIKKTLHPTLNLTPKTIITITTTLTNKTNNNILYTSQPSNTITTTNTPPTTTITTSESTPTPLTTHYTTTLTECLKEKPEELYTLISADYELNCQNPNTDCPPGIECEKPKPYYCQHLQNLLHTITENNPTLDLLKAYTLANHTFFNKALRICADTTNTQLSKNISIIRFAQNYATPRTQTILQLYNPINPYCTRLPEDKKPDHCNNPHTIILWNTPLTITTTDPDLTPGTTYTHTIQDPDNKNIFTNTTTTTITSPPSHTDENTNTTTTTYTSITTITHTPQQTNCINLNTQFTLTTRDTTQSITRITTNNIHLTGTCESEGGGGGGGPGFS